MARERECEHDDQGVICPVCDESAHARAKREARERRQAHLEMFGYPT